MCSGHVDFQLLSLLANTRPTAYMTYLIAYLMAALAACCLLLSGSEAVSGWLDISVQVWDEIRQEGNSKVWERSTYYDGSSSRAYIENRDLAKSKFTIPKNPANTKPLPALGDAIRSMRLNVTCEPPVVGGTCEMMMLNVSVQLYSFPLSKDRGGGAVGFNISYCDPALCEAFCSGNECVVSWSSLPGMDNTASALAILTNYPEFDQFCVANSAGMSNPTVPPPPTNATCQLLKAYADFLGNVNFSCMPVFTINDTICVKVVGTGSLETTPICTAAAAFDFVPLYEQLGYKNFSCNLHGMSTTTICVKVVGVGSLETTPICTAAAAFDFVPLYEQLSYQYIGCYSDKPTIFQQQNPTDHLVPYRLLDEPSGSLTTNKCAALAKAGGYSYFATQWGNQCWGGFGDYRLATILGESQSCRLLCSGDFAEICAHANWLLAGGGRRTDEEEATAAAAERIAAAAEEGTSLPVRLATDVVRFLYGGTGRREPADGGVVSASLLNAKPAVGGIGVEPRGGGVLRVLFTVASDAVADTVVRWRHELRRCVDSTAVFDVLSDREEAQHQALWPAFLAAKVAGKRAQFHRARLVVDGERVPAPAC
ncbi:hypothetical protein FOA52_008013 [Chlamydomonas sp. UWO 241]|nr:hypothetical protein FOA52_008013 [Chlamydomonas sp. UWO 241]